MNQKTLIGLAIAALVAIIAAIAINHANQPRSEADEAASTYLAPQLRGHVDDVSKVIVTGADNKTVATLERGAKGWGVVEKGGYAVDTGKLRDLMLKLSDAKLVEQKTAMKDKYALLGVEDVSDKDAKGVQVELDGLAKPLKWIIGSAGPHDGGTFVRRVGDAQSWLASGSLVVGRTAADWLKKDLVDIPATRIAGVTITHPDGSSVRVYKDAEGDADFKLADIPKGREAGSEYSVNGLASMLGGLDFEDVLPAKDAAPDSAALKAHYVTFDGLLIDVAAWQKDGKSYADFSASLDAAQADKGITADQAKATADYTAASAAKPAESKDGKAIDAAIKPLAISDPSKDHADRLMAIKKKVADLNTRFEGWTFVLPAYKYASIDKSTNDLLKPLETKKPAKEATKKPPAKAPKAKR
jgi:hypothetical protein